MMLLTLDLHGKGKIKREVGNATHELSDQVFFFLSQAAGKAMFDRRVHAPLQLRSCANQLTVKQRRKSFYHRVGSLF
jgi:hypothetical protein